MRIVVWCLRLLVFVLLLMLAAYNVQPVSFHFFADMAWEAPLMVMLLIAFVLGVLMMGFVLSIRVFDLQRQVSRLQKQRVSTSVSTASDAVVSEALLPDVRHR